MIKGSKHTEEQKRKISEGIKRCLPSTVFKKGHIPWIKTHKFSLESLEKISKAGKGRIPWNKNKHIALNNALEFWRKNGGHNKTEIKKGQHLSLNTEFKKGIKHTQEFKNYLSSIMKGRKFTEEWKRKISKSHEGNKCWNWKGGISYNIRKYTRNRYNNNKEFRESKLNSNRKRRGVGVLLIQTIQQVYEDNIKRYGTLTCYLCLKPIEFRCDSLEHKIPLSRGGTNSRDNLDIAHRSCNCKKHTKTEVEYKNGGASF